MWAHLIQRVIEIDIRGDRLERPAEVCDIIDVAVHVHVAAARHLHRPLNLCRQLQVWDLLPDLLRWQHIPAW